MYTYHRLIKHSKRTRSILTTFQDLFEFVYPVIWAILADTRFIPPLGNFIETYDSSMLDLWFWVLLITAIPYIAYLIIRIINTHKISNDKREAYRQQIMEQVDNVVLEKYNLLCNEVHSSSLIDNDVLIYNAHSVIRKALLHIKQLISNITGVSLENISVDFIYKYQGNHEFWHSIDGSVSCSIGQLDDIVERKESMYHYLYANNHEYTFFNSKADADWHMYRPSLRDSEDRSEWGSIYCKRILCTMHQDRFADGILSISTYNEKFTSSKHKAEIKEIEGLINFAVNAFTNIIKTEMASLYIRHEAIKKNRCETITHLSSLGFIDVSSVNPQEMTEEEQLAILSAQLPKFKEECNKLYPSFFEYDSNLDHKTLMALRNSQALNIQRLNPEQQ